MVQVDIGAGQPRVGLILSQQHLALDTHDMQIVLVDTPPSLRASATFFAACLSPQAPYHVSPASFCMAVRQHAQQQEQNKGQPTVKQQ